MHVLHKERKVMWVERESCSAHCPDGVEPLDANLRAHSGKQGQSYRIVQFNTNPCEPPILLHLSLYTLNIPVRCDSIRKPQEYPPDTQDKPFEAPQTRSLNNVFPRVCRHLPSPPRWSNLIPTQDEHHRLEPSPLPLSDILAKSPTPFKLTHAFSRGRNGIMLTMAASAGAFALLSYRTADRDRLNSQPGNLHVKPERSGTCNKNSQKHALLARNALTVYQVVVSRETRSMSGEKNWKLAVCLK